MKNSYKIVFTLVALLTTTMVFAQASPMAPPATPIDGGLSALLAAGGLYGLKKLRDHRRK